MVATAAQFQVEELADLPEPEAMHLKLALDWPARRHLEVALAGQQATHVSH